MKMSMKTILESARADVDYARYLQKKILTRKAEMAEDLMIGNQILENADCTPSYYHQCGAVVIDATITVTSFKEDPVLLEVLEKALNLAAPRATEDYIDENMTRREFRFVLPNGGTIRIFARLNEEEATACRKVQIGTKLQETPVYKIECD